jgi:cation:H+ antiporter
VSELAIGLTVVAFGTSLPELTVNIFAAVANQPDVAIGNITGSNIANILLVLGLSAMLNPLQVGRGTVWKEIPLCFLASLVLAACCLDPLLDRAATAVLSRSEGITLLGFFVIFLCYTIGIAHELPGLSEHPHTASFSAPKTVLLIVAGLVLLIAGGKAVVEGAVRLAAAAGLSEAFIAATVVAVGTSVPELATSVVAAVKKKADIAVGNVVGSNIFNVFMILGVTSVIRPLAVAPELMVGFWAGIVAAGLLFVCMFTGKRHKLDRWEGAVLLVLYVVYLFLQFR